MKKGFTLIELLVVITVFGIILITISTILINTVKVKNRMLISDQLESSGSLMLNNIRYNLLNAIPGTISCPLPSGTGSSIAFMDRNGTGNTTVLSCIDGDRIASGSATPGGSEFVYNDPSIVVPTGCGGFVACIMSGSDVLSIGVGFTLRAGNVDESSPNAVDSISRGFQTSVTIRN